MAEAATTQIHSPTATGTHILVIPFPAQGHLIPLLDLAHHLAAGAGDGGCRVTVVVTPGNLPLLSSFLASTPSASPLVLPLPSHPSLPPKAEHVRDLTPGGAHHPLHLSLPLSALRAPLLSWARSQAHRPTVLLSDFFVGWAHLLADELHVPHLVFYSSGAFTVAAFDFLWQHTPTDQVVHFRSLPTSPSFPYRHLPSAYRSYVAGAAAGDPDWDAIRGSFLLNPKSWAAVINTCESIEADFLAHLKESYGHDRVWAVGPIAPSGHVAGRGGNSSIPAPRIAAWLNSCPPRSVLYVCFGSQYTPSPSQAAALAAALECSGVRFVWAVSASAAVPEGFEESNAARGLLVRGWAPQVEILNNPAVGAFVTHCGWNSVLEGVAAGVLLVTWPMVADQFITARLLVEAKGVAVRAAEGPEAVPDAAELGRILADAVDETKWTEVRARAAELGKAAAATMADGGSSRRDFERMVKEIEAAADKK